jgi:competence protein ComEC
MIILLAAAGTALWNPLYLWSDIGWYLSFLAFFGIIVLAPLLSKRIYKIPKASKHRLGNLLIECVCAQIMTMPIIMYIFDQLSPLSIISNLLIVPLIPLAMLGSFIAGLLGIFLPAFSLLLAWPVRALLTAILDTIAMLSRLPFAVVHGTVDTAQMILLYSLVLLITIMLWRKTKPRHGIITDTNS